jgi:hypothetical protein
MYVHLTGLCFNRNRNSHITATIHFTHFSLLDLFSTGLKIQMNEADWVNWVGVGY